MNAFDLKDPQTKKMLMYGLPVVAVVAYVVLRKKSAAPTSTTSPITSGGNLGAGQISDLQQGYSNGFNQLQSQLNTLAGMMGSGNSPSTPSGSPTGTTVTTQVTGPPVMYQSAPQAQAPAAVSAPAAGVDWPAFVGQPVPIGVSGDQALTHYGTLPQANYTTMPQAGGAPVAGLAGEHPFIYG